MAVVARAVVARAVVTGGRPGRELLGRPLGMGPPAGVRQPVSWISFGSALLDFRRLLPRVPCALRNEMPRQPTVCTTTTLTPARFAL